MRILNVIDHILDKDSGNVVLSQKEIAKDNLEISKYVEKVIDKFEKSEYVELELSRIPMLEQFWNRRDDFQKLTEKFALDYFDSIKVNEKIPGGDLLFFNVELEDLSQMIGIAKLDYTQRYIHNVEYDEDVLVNNIVQNNSILPSPSQGVKNMLLIDGDKVQLREQQYTGASGKWLMSRDFLNVAAVPIKVSNNVKQIKKFRKSMMTGMTSPSRPRRNRRFMTVSRRMASSIMIISPTWCLTRKKKLKQNLRTNWPKRRLNQSLPSPTRIILKRNMSAKRSS